ncbi:hypothetical protein LCGC14_1897970 [marine sediment metagenome]|uniref:HTH cro/C1-type domain-containing protein n=1 Tax=marine sediment metagenome TaxID=412755 RepID=A0A0F9GKT3_9ZZZZ
MSNNKTGRNLSITDDYYNHGLTQREIAAKYDMSQQQISNILNDDGKELKEFRDKSIKRQFELLDLADEVVKRHLKDKSPMGKSLDAAKLVHKNTGITPSHTQVNIGKLVGQDNRSQTVEIQGLQEFMAFKYRDVGADKVIDVTPDEDKEADE